jgi:maltoporin
MKLKYTLLAAAALTLVSTMASAVDFGGYFRVGPGKVDNKETCVGLGAYNDGAASGFVGGFYRLGNECGVYGELSLSHSAKVENVDYKVTSMVNFYNDGGSSANGAITRIQQLYVEGKGYDIAPEQTFWIGERFYGRADVHISDAFFVNMSGTGAGMDGLNLGFGKLNLAVFRGSKGGPVGTRFNADLTDIDVNPGGKLRVTATATNVKAAGGKSGFALSLQHNQAKIFGDVDNTAWFQVAKGSAGRDQNFNATTDSSDAQGFRFVESMTLGTGQVTGQALAMIGQQQDKDALGNTVKAKEFSIGARVGYALTKNFKLVGEVGTSIWDITGADKQQVSKFTIAPTLTTGPDFYNRPELRFYVSGSKLNDGAAAARGTTKKTFSTVGFQAEVWF